MMGLLRHKLLVLCNLLLPCLLSRGHFAGLQVGGKAGAEGMTTNELKCAVEQCRQSCMEKRAAAGNAGPKTYDGLRGDTVSFSDQFAQVSS